MRSYMVPELEPVGVKKSTVDLLKLGILNLNQG